jgi:hypothetical protein
MASNGLPVVRPTVWLSGVADHAATDGLNGGDALQNIKEVLESEALVIEAREAAALKAAAQSNGPGGRSLPASPSPAAGRPHDGAA